MNMAQTSEDSLNVIDRYMPYHSNLQVIVKVTERCNLKCVYCSSPASDPKTMSRDAVDRMFSVISTYTPPQMRVNFTWHGGEPLLMGLEFFKWVKERQLQIEPSGRFSNAIQTNALLLNEEYLEFFRSCGDFKIGMSLDAPFSIGKHTRTPTQSLFDKTIHSIKLAADYGISPNAIMMVTRHALSRADEVFDFFAGNGINLQLNAVLACGRASSIFDCVGVTPMEHANFCNEMFDRWFWGSSGIRLNPYTRIVEIILGSKAQLCSMGGICAKNTYRSGCRGKCISMWAIL